MVRLAHLTDPHVGPLPRPRLRQLMGKRFTGWVNWHRGRSAVHDMEILAALVADMHAHHPAHIACTGDLCNIGLPNEWRTSRVFLEELGPPDRVSLVPGNHDAYVRGSLEGLLAECAPWTKGDDGIAARFPYIRRRGRIAYVGLSSAIPTRPFIAAGKCGKAQLRVTEMLLADLGREGLFRVVMVHHPPHAAGGDAARGLKDHRAFEAMIARVGAELVIHGHNHVSSIDRLPGPNGARVPVVGAPSASARHGTYRAGYHLYTIEEGPAGFRLDGEARGLRDDGSIGPLLRLDLAA